jgi:hypothetical protein
MPEFAQTCGSLGWNYTMKIVYPSRDSAQGTPVDKKLSTGTIRAGMHNIRPAGQMWPAKAFNLARIARSNLRIFGLIFDGNTIKIGKKLKQSGPQMSRQHFFGPPRN